MGHYSDSLAALKKAHGLYVNGKGINHLCIAQSSTNIGCVLNHMGDFAGAFKSALAILEK